eukprot:3110290-Alexandrium_andersonii.AAC.1
MNIDAGETSSDVVRIALGTLSCELELLGLRHGGCTDDNLRQLIRHLGSDQTSLNSNRMANTVFDK